jgi:serine/threonine protein kinase
MTKTSVMMGSPLYMSPEQMRSSRDVDARTDIWALGIILFELLVGHPPFYADSIPELYVKVLTTSAGSILQKRPDLPAGLDAAIARCLGKSPADRYLNVAELANALAEFAPKRARATIERISRVIQNAGLSASALALPPSSDPAVRAGPSSPPTQTAWGETKQPTRWRSTTLPFGVAALALATVAGGVLWLRREPHDATTPPREPVALSVAPSPQSSTLALRIEPSSAPSAALPATAPAAPVTSSLSPPPPVVLTPPPVVPPKAATRRASPVSGATKIARPTASAEAPRPAPASQATPAPVDPFAQPK